MPITINPQDEITPAIQNLGATLGAIEQQRRAEGERKLSELSKLSAFSIKNITDRDNKLIQDLTTQFTNDAAGKYRQYNGNLPFEEQSRLSQAKTGITTEIEASQQWQKEYEDAVKAIATNKDIDRDKSRAALNALFFKKDDKGNLTANLVAPSQRPSPYDAISLNFDRKKYIKETLLPDPVEDTVIGKSKYGTEINNRERRTVAQVSDSIFKSWQDDPRMKNSINTDMAARNLNYKDPSAVYEYIKANDAPQFIKDNSKISLKAETHITNNMVKDKGLGVPVPGPVRNAVETSTINGKKSTWKSTISVAENLPWDETKATFPSNSVYDLNGLSTKKSGSPVDKQMTTTGIDMVPVVWSTLEKKWIPVTDASKEKPQRYAPFIVGVGSEREELKKGDPGYNEASLTGNVRSVDKQYYVQSTPTNLASIDRQFTPAKNFASSKVDKGKYSFDFGEPYKFKFPDGHIEYITGQELSNYYVAQGKKVDLSKYNHNTVYKIEQ